MKPKKFIDINMIQITTLKTCLWEKLITEFRYFYGLWSLNTGWVSWLYSLYNESSELPPSSHSPIQNWGQGKWRDTIWLTWMLDQLRLPLKKGKKSVHNIYVKNNLSNWVNKIYIIQHSRSLTKRNSPCLA